MKRRELIFSSMAGLIMPLPVLAQSGDGPQLRLSGDGLSVTVAPAGPGRMRLTVQGPEGREAWTGSFDPASVGRVAAQVSNQRFLLETDEGTLTVTLSRGRLRIEGGGRPPSELVVGPGATPNLLVVATLVGMAVGVLVFHIAQRVRIPRPRPRRRARLLAVAGGAVAPIEIVLAA